MTAERRSLAPALVLNTCAFVVLELALTRTLAVTQWYHFAFMVISVSLLGGGLGPLVLTRLGVTTRAAALFRLRRVLFVLPVGAFASFWVFDSIPFEPFLLGADASQWFFVPFGCLLLAFPFFLAGMATALFFVARRDESHRLYFFDLAGAALGALLFGTLVAGMSAYGTVTFACVLWSVAALWLTRGHPLVRPVWVVAATSLAALVLLAPSLEVRISVTKRIGPRPAGEVLQDKRHTVFSDQTADARVDVIRTRDGFRLILDAGTSVTRLLGRSFVPRVLRDLQAVLGELQPQSVLVLGSGGGLEVRLALAAGAERVVAVELNPLVNELVTGPFAGAIDNVFDDPRVELHTEEGRHFLLGTEERFDAILCVHTISNAALGSGGLSLAENYTLTREAFETYYDHLTERGVAFFTRPRFQLRRLFDTAAAAWSRRGHPRLEPHAIAGSSERQRFYGALLVSRPPLTSAQRRGVAAAFQRVGLVTASSLVSSRRDTMEPSTDDRPFFNQRTALTDLTWEDVASVFEGSARLTVEDRPVAEVILLLLLGQLTILGGLLFVVPLILARRRHSPAGGRRFYRAGLYFFLLGLAFIFVEVALIQKLTLYLGQPSLAFAVVLAGLLVFAGIGSLTDHGYRPEVSRGLSLAVALPLALVATVLAIAPVMNLVVGAGFGVRITTALVLIAPASFLMGRPFVRGLRWIGHHRHGVSSGVAWAFALNGFASVLSSLLAVMLGMTLGLNAVVFVAAGLYLLSGLLLLPSDSDRAARSRAADVKTS